MRIKINKTSYISFFSVLIFLGVLFSIYWSFLNKLEEKTLNNSIGILSSYLESNEKIINLWIKENLELVKNQSKKKIIKDHIYDLIDTNKQISNKKQLQSRKILSDFLLSSHENEHELGFFIVDTNKINVVSNSIHTVGKKNYLEKYGAKYLDSALNGKSVFVPPQKFGSIIFESTFKHRAMYYFLNPIFDENNNVIAVLGSQGLADFRFSQYLMTTNIDDDFESYAYNQDGFLLSHSRYEDQLVKKSFIQSNQSSIYNINIKKLSPNSPMINSAFLKKDGYSKTPYLNYFGKKVLGVWKWNTQYDFGIVTEVSYDYIIESYKSVRFIVSILMLIIVIIGVTIIVLVIVFNYKKTQKLQKDNELLNTRIISKKNELKEVSKDFQNTKTRLLLALNSSKMGLWEYDRTRNIFNLDGMIRELFGVGDGKIDLQTVNNKIHPDDVERVKFEKKNSFKKQKTYEGIYRIIGRGNKVFWIHDIGTSYQDSKGNMVYATGVIWDISNLKEVEEKLQVTQERFEFAIKGSGDILWEYDHDNNIMWYSPRFKEVLGYELGPKINDLYMNIHLDDLKYKKKAFNNHILNNDNFDIQYRIRDINGEYRWFRSRAKSVAKENGKIIKSSGTLSDISDLKLAETELLRSKEVISKSETRLNLSNESAGVAVWEWNIKSDLVEGSDLFYEMIGFDKSDKIIVNDLYQHIVDTDRNKILREINRHLDGNTESFKLEYRYIHPKSNQIVWINHSGKVVEREFDGSPIIMMGVSIDITDRKNIEIELEKAKEAAEEATRAKSDFLANMSHEIRTPMNAIIGLNHLLSKTKLTDKQNDYVKKVRKSAHNLLGIINDVLDFSKIEAGHLDIEHIYFDINEVMSDLSDVVTVKASEKDLELVFYVDNKIPGLLYGDPLRLWQILLNITNNAIKFTNSGEIKVSINVTEVFEDRVDVTFSVVDPGVGMTPETVDKLFSAFTQADSSTTREFGGTGLGLTISQKLAQMMGSKIYVESKLNQGSRFHFTIPFEFKKDENLKKISLPEGFSNLNVLIIDDSNSSLDTLQMYLQRYCATVDTVDNAKGGYEKFCESITDTKSFYDLILVDWTLGEIFGINIVEKIQQHKELLNPPKLILMSNNGNELFMKQLEQVHVDGALFKPINASILFDTVLNIFGYNDSHLKLSLNRDKHNNFEDRSLSGVKILLTDDNEMNQQILCELLESEEATVEVCSNGKEALDLINEKKNHFDLSLMDLQMPVMGGLDATVAIRKTQSSSNLPIIALTADAVGDVESKIKAAGMDALLTKPIEPEKLFDTIFNVLTEFKQITFKKKVTKVLDENVVLPEIYGINTDEGLKRVNYKVEMYLKLLKSFVNKYSNFYEEISKSILEKKWEHTRFLLHSIKGVSANIGANDIANQCNIIHEQIHTDNDFDFTEYLDTLKVEIKKTCDDINKSSKLEKVISDDGKVVDLLFLKDKLLLLQSNLENDMSIVMKENMEINKLLKGSKYYRDFKKISNLIDDFETDKANEKISDFIEKYKINLSSD